MWINIFPEDFENTEWKQAIKDIIREASESMNLQKGEISVKLVDDDGMKAYNEKYTDRKGATDVLAFPFDSEKNPEEKIYYGDIIISEDKTKKQAKRRDHSRIKELKILTLHGFLHLLGYDHTEDSGEMKDLERKLL